MGQPHLHQRSGVRVQRAARRDGLQHLQPLAQRGHLPECPRGGLQARLQRAAPGLLLPGRVAAPGAGRHGPAGDRRREPHAGGVLQVVPAGSAEEYRSHHAERFRGRVPRPEGGRTSARHISLRPRDAMPARGRGPVQGGPCGHRRHGRPHFPGGRRVGLHQRHSSPALFSPEVLRTPDSSTALIPPSLLRRAGSELEDRGPRRRVMSGPETQNQPQEPCPILRPPAPILAPQEWSPACPTSTWLTDAHEPHRVADRSRPLSLPAGTGTRSALQPRGELPFHEEGGGAEGEGRTQAGSCFSWDFPPTPTPAPHPGQRLVAHHLSLPQLSQLPHPPLTGLCGQK